MSILVAFLLNLLVSFIIMMIKRWLDSNSSAPTAEYLAGCRQEFLDKVSYRFWLGPGRMERAQKAFDMAVTKYSEVPKIYFANNGKGSEQKIAEAMVEGIAEKL